MDFIASPIQFTLVLATALLATVVALLGIVRRGPWMTSLLFAAAFLAVAGFQAGTLGILHAGTAHAARNWAIYLARSSALASWLWLALSVVLARTDPWLQIRNAGGYLTLALLGCLGMSAVAGSPGVVREVVGRGGDAQLLVGTMGKVYLMYLVVVMVAVLMNLERMLRTSQVSAQRRLRPLFLAVLVGIFSQLMVVSAGLLYARLKVAWLVASAAPVFVAGVASAMALGRRRLLDVMIPAERPVFQYSSVSLTLAGVFLLTMAVLSRILPILTPEWKRTVSLSFYLVAGCGGLLLILSPRANRGVRRFIDRSLYASRYNYRREWERVSGTLIPASLSPEAVCQQVEALVRSVFDAERAAIYLRDDGEGPFIRLHGPDTMPEMIEPENPLVIEFQHSKFPLMLRDATRDLDLIPVAVENRAAIQALTAALCVPLSVGDRLIGLLWLSEKRNREEYPFGDVEYLGTMSRQLAAALWLARGAEQLAAQRQSDAMRRLSGFMIEDLRNRIVDLSRTYEAGVREPTEASAAVHRALTTLREVAAGFSWITRAADLSLGPCSLQETVAEALQAAGLVEGEQGGVCVRVQCAEADPPVLDRTLIVRALTELLINAREAIEGRGEIEVTVQFERSPDGGPGELVLRVRDTGPGMTADFVRNGLFLPYVSTKPGRLGVGLARTRSIVLAHGGSIDVSSRPETGSIVSIHLPIPGPHRGAGPEAGASRAEAPLAGDLPG